MAKQLDARLREIEKDLKMKFRKKPDQVILEIFDRLSDRDYRRHADGRIYSSMEKDELIKSLDKGGDQIGLIEIEIIRN